MKQFFLFLALTLGYGIAVAQIVAPTTSDSIIIQLDMITPLEMTLVSNDDSTLADVHCYAVKISNTSSHDFRINGASIQYEKIYAEGMIQFNNTHLYREATIVSGMTAISAGKFGGLIGATLPEPGVIIPGQTSVSLRLKSDLYGWGIISFALSSLDVTDLQTGDKNTVSPTENVSGYNITMVNTDHLDIATYMYPKGDVDTLAVLPGEYVYSTGYFGTADYNFLPGAVSAFKSRVEIDLNLRNLDRWDFTLPYLNWLDESGLITYEAGDATHKIVWTSDYTNKGINGFNFSRMSGYNTLPVGATATINFAAEAVMFTPICRQRRNSWAGRNRVIKSVDGIRGDFDGDGDVDLDDLTTAQEIYTRQGDFQEYLRWNEFGANAGRLSVLFGSPELIDISMIHHYLYQPNDPSVRDLGIGKLMSARVTSPLPTSYTASYHGKFLLVTTKGFAVRVSTVLPNGQPWSSAGQVGKGGITFTLPDSTLKYRIEAVLLPNGVTGLSEDTEVPTEFNLGQNYPNPFNPSTTIDYSLPQAGLVKLAVYNLLGQEVLTLVNGEMSAGTHQAKLDAGRLGSGTYFYRLQSGNFTSIKKMVLMK